MPQVSSLDDYKEAKEFQQALEELLEENQIRMERDENGSIQIYPVTE